MAALCCALAGLSILPAGASAAPRPHGLGLVETVQPSSRASKVIRFSAASLPAAVDLTAYAARVGDQGQVNSCAAWATDYTALGYWENRQGITGGVLAPMYTYSQVTGGKNVGTTIRSHLDIARSQGVDSWSDYWQGPTNYWQLPTAAETTNAAQWKLTTYQELGLGWSAASTVTQQSIEQAVAAGDPVIIGIPVYDNFMYLGSANHGFYAGIGGAYDGGHAVTVLGYDTTGVRIENSWGTRWGDSGYATLSWAFVNQYVLEAVAVGQLVASAPTTTAPVNAVLPAISGTTVAGQTLTASLGTWSPSGASPTIRWQKSTDRVSWSDIAGASSLTYTEQAGDVGYYLRVVVTESNSGGQATANSTPVGPVSSGPPRNVTPPTVSGTAQVGATLIASAGAWVPAGATYAYAWQYSADGRTGWLTTPGGQSASFTIGASYAGRYLRVQVTAANTSGRTVATSAVVGPVAVGAPVNTMRPTISGSARVGQTLFAGAGSWSPSGTLTYAWQRSPDGGASWQAITGATTTSYTITSADSGALLRVRVTATNTGGTSAAYSSAMGPVALSGRRPLLRLGQARVSSRSVSFTVALPSGSGQPQATAVAAGRSVRLRAHGHGSHYTFTGRLSQGRWVVTVRLASGQRSFVVTVGR